MITPNVGFNIKDHKHYSTAYNAHRNTSHVPEKRAAQECEAFDYNASNVTTWGGDLAKHERLFLNHMHAKARCASSMITGPAGFNTARNDKANRAEQNHGEAYYSYLNKLEEKHKQAAFYAANPHARPVRASDTDALKRLHAKLDAAKAHHAHLKANPSERRHGMALAYALRDVKEVEARISSLNSMKESPAPNEATRYVVDTEAARVYFTFDDKPDEKTRTLLKSCAFKWTPSKGHWGRMLTPNAIEAARLVAKTLAEIEG